MTCRSNTAFCWLAMMSSKDRTIVTYFDWIQYANHGLSILASAVLMFVILRNIAHPMGTYKYLLLVFACNEMWYTIVHGFTHPVIGMTGDAFFMFSDGLFRSKWSICAYASVHSQITVVLAYHFVFRWITIEKNHLISLFTQPLFILLLIGIYVVEFNAWFWNCYLMYATDSSLSAHIRGFLEGDWPATWKNHIGALYWTEGFGSQIRIRPLLGTLGFNLILLACLGVIFFCITRIGMIFRKTIDVASRRTQAMQRNLFYILLLQLAVPFFLMYLPCAFIITLPFLGLRLSPIPNLISLICSFFPFIDATIVIFGIRDYRETLLRALRIHQPPSASSATSIFAVTEIPTRVSTAVAWPSISEHHVTVL